MIKILCAGNRYCPEDSFGPEVYDLLMQSDPPSGIDIVDAGIAGLDLLHHFEEAHRVVVVDAVSGFGKQGEVVRLEYADINRCKDVEYGHSGGLHYLLLCLPSLGITPSTSVTLVGYEGIANTSIIRNAATLALESANA